MQRLFTRRVLAVKPRALAVAQAARSRSFHTATKVLPLATSSYARLHKPSLFGTSLVGLNKRSMQKTQARYLNLHEYQSKGLMASYGIRVQKGEVATSVEEAYEVAKRLVKENAKELVLKAQIHAGGRGKGHFNTGFKGGVKVCTGPKRAEEVRDLAAKMLGNSLITAQTGPEGQVVRKVLVHEGITFKKETYFAILMDRQYNGPVIVASPFGGVDIEETAHKNPNAIFKEPVDIKIGITDAQATKVAGQLGFSGASQKDAAEQIKRLYAMFIGTDSTQVEINPFVLASDGKVYCVDAKLNFDDNASFRQTKVYDMRDTTMEDPRDVEASKFNLNYIALDGNIGCMVNGAGLAMATMDIIKLHGGSPANFLDVGGGANEKQVEEAFKILTADPRVKALLVNIFGGIMQCDIIAKGIINAAKNVKLTIPLVVRLEGTNVDKGNKLLSESGIAIITASNLDDAAKKAVKAIGL